MIHVTRQGSISKVVSETTIPQAAEVGVIEAITVWIAIIIGVRNLFLSFALMTIGSLTNNIAFLSYYNALIV